MKDYSIPPEVRDDSRVPYHFCGPHRFLIGYMTRGVELLGHCPPDCTRPKVG